MFKPCTSFLLLGNHRALSRGVASSSLSSSSRVSAAAPLRPLTARRRWESALSDVLSERGQTRDEALAAKFESVYVKKEYVPVSTVFPHSSYESKRWTGSGASAADSAAFAKSGGGGGGGNRGRNRSPQNRQENEDEDPVEVEQWRKQQAEELSRRRKEFAERRKRLARGAPSEPYCLRVALLGPPNAGKSTLLNTLVATHVSAESKRAGTTVDWVKGVTRVHDTQIQLLDTPGIFLPADKQMGRSATHKPTARLDKFRTLRLAAWDSLFSADVALLALPVGLGFLDPQRKQLLRDVAQRCRMREVPLILAMTKMDLLHNERHLVLYRHLRSDLDTMRVQFAETCEVSSLLYKGVVELKDALASFAKPGAWEFSKTDVTDLNQADRVSEILREAIFDCLPHIVPHQTTHKIVGWTAGEDKLGNKVTQVIVEVFFEKPSFMHVFLQKQLAIAQTSRERCKVTLKQNVWFHFQAFVAPTGKNRL